MCVCVHSARVLATVHLSVENIRTSLKVYRTVHVMFIGARRCEMRMQSALRALKHVVELDSEAGKQ